MQTKRSYKPNLMMNQISKVQPVNTISMIKTGDSAWLFNNNNNTNHGLNNNYSSNTNEFDTKSSVLKIQIQADHNTREISMKTNSSGSLSSDTSLDELSNDELTSSQTSGLTISASRVSRFRSAKEFFERLSSAQNSNGTSQSPVKSKFLSQDRSSSPRINIASRYTATLQAKSVSNGNLNHISTTSPSSPPRSRPTVFRNISSNVINNDCPSPHTTTRLSFGPAPTRSHSSIELMNPSDTCHTSLNMKSNSTNQAANDSTLKPDYNELKPCNDISGRLSNFEKIQDKSDVNIGDHDDTNTTGNNISNDEITSCEGSEFSVSNDDLMCEVTVFKGDNVIVGNGSLLNRRNKQLKIKFDESNPTTYEYPSEGFLLAEPESLTESLNSNTQPQEIDNFAQNESNMKNGSHLPSATSRKSKS